MTLPEAFLKQRNDDFFGRTHILICAQVKHPKVGELAAEITEQCEHLCSDWCAIWQRAATVKPRPCASSLCPEYQFQLFSPGFDALPVVSLIDLTVVKCDSPNPIRHLSYEVLHKMQWTLINERWADKHQ